MRYTALILLLSVILACDPPPTVRPAHETAALNMNGNGIAYLPDGSIYEGQFQNGLFHGQGSLKWNNGDVHKGSFVAGKIKGHGTFSSTSGHHYEGEHLDGLWHGEGHYQDETGQSYSGTFNQGVFSGYGKYTTYDGDLYEGEFKLGRPNGQIELTYASGEFYTGTIKDWKFEGQGTYVADDVTYSGTFKNGKLNGMGKIIRPTGRYEGSVEDWASEGQGTWRDNKGNKYVGEFKNGDYHGQGKYYYKNGDVYEGSFEDGLYHGKGMFHSKNPKGDKGSRIGWWQYGKYAGATRPTHSNKARGKKLEYKIADVLYQQPALLKKNLDALEPHRPGVTDLYFISYAPYDKQDVFMNEARLSTSLFKRYLRSQSRSILLINNKKTIASLPLAININLRNTLVHIASLMDIDEDVVFLFITSHGSKKNTISSKMHGVKLENLSVKNLKMFFAKARIKWKVIVISACYSGGFIESFKDPYSMILTAASEEHVSFGCSDQAELTYFGRAFLKQSLNTKLSFIDAFSKAKRLIKKWEKQQGYSHSNPQIFVGKEIKKKLSLWRASLQQRN